MPASHGAVQIQDAFERSDDFRLERIACRLNQACIAQQEFIVEMPAVHGPRARTAQCLEHAVIFGQA
jgi:hypothetical protein